MPQRMIAILGALLLGSGCSAIHGIHGVPAAYMPTEYMAESREGKATIDYSLLQRSQTDQYRIEAGDVLAIYAPGLLGLVDTHPDQPRGENPPINMPQNLTDRPSLGFPVTVRDDNTIQIPQLPAIDVYGLTEGEVEAKLRQAVQQTGLLAKETQPRLVVSIMRPRTYRVLVCRQEAATAPTPTVMAGMIDIGRSGKGTSRIVDLRAGENDVAHALAQPGVDGLPGLDAKNIIYVIRARNARASRSRVQHPTYLDPQPTPITQNGRDYSGRSPLIRGQSPSSNWGRPATSKSSGQGQGPYAYLTASQFSLSGQEVAQGSHGPALIDPIPPSADPTNRMGVGAATPNRQASHNPTYSPRNTSNPIASRYALTPVSVAAATVAPVNYQPVQYAAPQSAPPLQATPQNTIPQNSPPQQYNTSPYGGTPSGPWSNPAPVVAPPAVMAPNAGRYPTQSAPQMAEPLPANSVWPTPVMTESVGIDHGGMVSPAPNWQQTLQDFDPTIRNSQVIKIPVRLAPGEELDLTEEDITLYDGDIVFIDNRDTDVYFIGGLLGGGQYPLPRDRDLHVLEAVSLAQGMNSTRVGSQGLQSSGGVSALNRDIVPSASRLLILRQVGDNQRLTLEVDLYKALRYPHENILVQPRDMLILQYTPAEAVLAFVQRNVFEGALLGIAAGSLQSGGSGGR